MYDEFDLLFDSGCCQEKPCKRPDKGNSIIRNVSEYVSVDIETTGLGVNSCSIIEIGAVHVRDGEIISEFSSLCNPHIDIDPEVSKLTGITNDMVRCAPEMSRVIGDFCEFIGDHILVGHNIASFDSCVLYDAFAACLGFPMYNDMIDTMRIARRALPFVPNCKLNTLLDHFSIHNDQAHRALSDAICTHQLYERLKPNIADDKVIASPCVFSSYSYESIYEDTLKMLNADTNTVTLKINKSFATVFMFKRAAFSVRIDDKHLYLESSLEPAFDHLSNMPGTVRLKNTARFPLCLSDAYSKAMSDLLMSLYEYCAGQMNDYSMMACCNDFINCSDQMQCIHKYDPDYAGCWYRKNLENGRIFYGKNKNM